MAKRSAYRKRERKGTYKRYGSAYRKSAYKKSRRRISYRKPKSYSKSKWSRKSKYRKGGKSKSRTFRKGRHLSLPSTLYSMENIASSVLGTFSNSSATYFCNMKLTSSYDLSVLSVGDMRMRQRPLRSMQNMNPTTIMSLANENLGLDTSLSNPPIKMKKIVTSYSGNEKDPGYRLSFYKPFVNSWFSANCLSDILNIDSDDWDAMILVARNGVPITVSAYDPNTRTHNYMTRTYNEFADMAVDNVINADLRMFSQGVVTFFGFGDLQPSYNTWLILDAFVRGAIYTQTPLANSSRGILIFSDNTYTNYTFSFGANNAQTYANIDAALDPLLQAKNPTIVPHSKAGNPTFSLLDNEFQYSLSLLSMASKETSAVFLNFISEYYRSIEASRQGLNFTGGNSFLHAYLSNCFAKEKIASFRYNSLNELIRLGYVKAKPVSLKKVTTFYPKESNNTHFITVPLGVECKISIHFSRNYSGFMALFKDVSSSADLRKYLSSAGIELFKKLQPDYNLKLNPYNS